ncbi:hypothetical protein ROHU_016725 [Labeo rohita]|uniref:Uncharacterized protein n=1 Tax=Labeo rohita TaxID=84645 RepID=A0A498NIF6_LABRO|nr:hypothetical protein ROHU_016725 [Labeo rohita]
MCDRFHHVRDPLYPNIILKACEDGNPLASGSIYIQMDGEDVEDDGLSPNIKGVLARPGLRIGDRLRRLMLWPVPLLHLRVVPGDGVGRGEVVKI